MGVKVYTQHYGPGEGFSPLIHGQSVKRLRRRTGGVFRCLRYEYILVTTRCWVVAQVLSSNVQAATRTNT